MEQSVLDSCSTVLAVTPLVQEDFAGTVTPDGCFNLVHTGLFAADGNPLVLWKVLGGMAARDAAFRDALRLRLVGKVDREVREAIAAEGLADRIVDLGYRDHAAAVQEQRTASVLLLPLRNDPDYRIILPGKLFEYLAARRPVLGIGQEDGAMARVLADTQAGITAGWDNENAVRAYLEAAWAAFRGEPFAPQPGLQPGLAATTGAVEQYTRTNLTKSLAALLDSVTA